MFNTDFVDTGRERLPKLVFFRTFRDKIPAFLKAHVAEHSRCLSQFFEVVELGMDCDYDEVCDRYHPDIVLFESGVDSGNRLMRNTSAHPHVAKLGFLHADAVDAARATFISNMAEWGVETFFTHSVAMGEYTPEIADRLYVWPNFIDPDIFRDYGAEKVVPVLFTGSQIGLYPWRNAVSRVLSVKRPTMVCPHVGWHAEAGSQQMLFGEKYARLLNASTFVPTCGSVTRDLVRKHLEIPASGACLVTERTAALESAGFRDMVNCVFATPEDVVEKLDVLFDDPHRLESIVQAGHDLVHARHTMVQRSQIREWFDLKCRLKAGETIVQDGPFERLRAAPSAARQANRHVVSGGLDRLLSRRGWELISAGEPHAAEALFLRCLNHFIIPEALVGLAYCQLLKGDSKGAKNSINRWLDTTFVYHKCKDPDPVAWATGIRVALCCGSLEDARAKALQFPYLRHEELDRIRKILRVDVDNVASSEPQRPSIAPTPNSDECEWRRQLTLMLRACGQAAIDSAIATDSRPISSVSINGSGGTSLSRGTVAIRRSRDFLVDLAKAKLRKLKRTYTENEWTFQVGRVVSCEPVLRAVILQPSLINNGQRALRRSLRSNPWLPKVVEMGRADIVESITKSPFHPGDLVYVTAGSARLFELTSLIEMAGVVLIEGTNLSEGQGLTDALLASAEFSLILHDATGKAGYAIFRRMTPQLEWRGGLLGEFGVFSGNSIAQ